MKKVKMLSVAAAIFAIGSAFAPKAVESLRNRPNVIAFVPAAPCTATLQCPDTGSKLCGYRQAGCTSQVSKP